MDRRAAFGRAAVAARRLKAPRSPKAVSVGPSGVTLRWSAPKGAKPVRYLVLRDGKVVARTAHRSYTDHTVRPGRTYRYTVRAVDGAGRRGAASRTVRVAVPKRKTAPLPAPGGSAGPPAPVAPSGPAPAAVGALTPAMVDRLFWRAGFGPSAAHRATWTGRTHEALVDWLLDTPPSLADTSTPRPLPAGADATLDPLASEDDMVMEWLDAMQRVDNPLPERLTFFWHRHWAVSRDDGIPAVWLLGYRDRLRRYADLPRRPGLSFRDLCYEMSTADPAMSMYLDGDANVKGRPNENYAREFMELFCLGPKGPDGTDNYTQTDVQELAKAFTGWRLNGVDTTPDYGRITFTPAFFEPGAKTVLGSVIPPAAVADGPACVNLAIDSVLRHRNHAPFLIRKLWAEFIAGPIPEATLAGLVAAYTAGGAYALRPVLRGILTHPLIFESLDEPNLIKPPVVYMVGLLRALGAPMRGGAVTGALTSMQQRPYRPPNVAGWEGGLSWLNSNTVQARFNAVLTVQALKYGTTYSAATAPPEVPVESVQATFDRAYAAAGSPWLAASTREAVVAYAATLAVNSPVAATAARQRRQRFYTIQALILGGPDGQVM